MAQLDDLPTEVVQMICLRLNHDVVPPVAYTMMMGSEEGELARRALRNLCLVSTRYRHIAQPVLWKSCGDLVTDSKMPTLLLQAVLNHPHLAEHIEHLDLFCTMRDAWTELPADTSQFAAVIRSFDVDFAAEWIDRLNHNPEDYSNGVDEAFVALFLALLPRLKRIRFCWTYDCGRILGKLASAQERLPGCKHLEELLVYHGDTEYGFEFGEAISLLKLPALKKVTMGMVVEDTSYNLLPKSLDITNIHYQVAGVGKEAFRTMLAACKRVEHVHFEGVDVTTLQDSDIQPLTPRQVVELLKPHRLTLKSLILDFRGFFEYFDEDFLEMWGVDGQSCVQLLKELDAVEELIIDQQCFTCDAGPVPGAIALMKEVLVAQLPPSIKSLTIRRANMVMTSAVEHLAEGCVANFPHLRSITIKVDNESSTDTYEGSRHSFEEAKINYRVVEEGEDYYAP